MKAFTYERAQSPAAAAAAVAKTPGAKFIAGGTNLLDLMKLQIETPVHLVDVNRLGLDKVEATPDGGLKIGALVRNADLAADTRVRKDYGVLARALLAGASGQLRNRATTAGNLLQRSRCPYFYDTAKPCNKRLPGSGCSALEGFSRNLAVMGVSDACISQHPSDMAVAMRLLDAKVETVAGDGATRSIDIADFHTLPGETPDKETVLKPGEMITAVTLPAPLGGTHVYRKVRDRASYAFATVAVAAVVAKDGRGIDKARIAFGGIGAKPWRVAASEDALSGTDGADAAVKRSSEAVLADARPTSQNRFKLALTQRTLNAALAHAMNG